MIIDTGIPFKNHIFHLHKKFTYPATTNQVIDNSTNQK